MTSAAETRLELRRTLDAPPREVFEAWTRPETIRQWFRHSAVDTPFASWRRHHMNRHRLPTLHPAVHLTGPARERGGAV
jgi:uncharacterized protein YndB with AHSA1/START domain